ncbi:MAG: hypothetical protein K0Q54_2273 [Methylobacterium brachiatum]|jgi:hypothetical protein|nr:hypothetical protein [Methylobacterium brachiatum]
MRCDDTRGALNNRESKVPRRFSSEISPSLRRSFNERENILQRFDDLIITGADRNHIADNLGTSLSTIYRWKRQREAQEAAKDRFTPLCISIEEALAILARPIIENKFVALEAVFKLIAWLRWPNSPHNHPAAIATCAITYLSRDSVAITLNELPAAGLALILKHISVGTFRKMCAGDAANLPNLDVWPLHEQNYDEFDYFADIVNFLLAYQPLSKDKRDAASLGKAYDAHSRGLFNYTWQMTLETFRRNWAVYGPATPFFYVRKYHLAYDLILDPSDNSFNDSVDRLWKDRSETMAYLSRCRTAVDLLRERLDSRTAGARNFPLFPESIPAAPLEIRPLPADANAVLNGRKS